MATKNTRTSSSKKKSNTGSASRKTTSSRKGSSRKRRRSKKQSRIYRENAIFITISVISLLLMISILGHGGSFGALFRELQFGFSGLLAYIFPILLFALSVYLYVGKKKNNKYARALVYVILFVFICFFAQLVSGNYAGGDAMQAAFYSRQAHRGGGLIGGGLESLIRGVFGLIGAYLIDIAVIILCLVYLTGKSFVAGVGRGTAKAYNKAYTKTKENIEYQKEQRSKKKEEESRLRMDHKVSGVSFDTKVGDSASASGKKQTGVKVPGEGSGRKYEPSLTGKGAFEKSYSRQAIELAKLNKIPQEESYASSKQSEKANDALSSRVDVEAQADSYEFYDDFEDIAPFAEMEETSSYGMAAEDLFSESNGSEVKNMQEELSSYDSYDYEDEEEGEEAEDPRAILEELARPAAAASALAAGGAAAFAAGTKPKEEQAEKSSNSSYSERQEGASSERKEASEETDGEIEISDHAPEAEAYRFPSLELLARPAISSGGRDEFAYQNQKKLQDTMQSFGVNVTVTGFQQGPTVTRYELLPAAGVKVSKILSLSDDLKLALAAADIRIEAPIPGKSAIGIEVPNKTRVTVSLRELIDTEAFAGHKSKIAFAAGKDINGNVILADIQKMPHLLIAGATGSGKSVCINTIIMSILYKARPDEVKLIMIDPKVVELSVYNGIPHLLTPVVTDPKKAASALNWAVAEMTRRYQLFAAESVRDIKAYNAKARKKNAEMEEIAEILPQIVIIVDELADLMMVAPSEVEDAICRLAQLARAAGLHLVIATQRPSVNVITGLIKANMPSRIAFSVSSGVDSRTILDMNGAEKLLGNGDMLYYPQGLSKPLRVQGAFVSDDEVSAVVEAVKENNEKPEYNEEISNHEIASSGSSSAATESGEERDELFQQAGRFLIEANKGSIGSLQRKFRIGFNRAARIVDQLEEAGVLGPEEGTKPRQILMTIEEFECLVTGKSEGEEKHDD